jgi:aryl carrier-like protein
MRFIAAIVISSALLASGVAHADDKKIPKQIQQLLEMTPEQFESSADLKDDSLETVAVITTLNGWQKKDGLLKIVNDDQFFRAFIDKKSGRTTFQVYQVVHYMDSGWAFFEIVNYETPTGPQSVQLDVINRDVGGCSRYLGCSYVETVGFNVDEALLRKIASLYAPGKLAAWKYRIKAKSGAQRDEGFVAAEVAGLLRAVDKYRASHGFSTGS